MRAFGAAPFSPSQIGALNHTDGGVGDGAGVNMLSISDRSCRGHLVEALEAFQSFRIGFASLSVRLDKP